MFRQRQNASQRNSNLEKASHTKVDSPSQSKRHIMAEALARPCARRSAGNLPVPGEAPRPPQRSAFLEPRYGVERSCTRFPAKSVACNAKVQTRERSPAVGAGHVADPSASDETRGPRAAHVAPSPNDVDAPPESSTINASAPTLDDDCGSTDGSCYDAKVSYHQSHSYPRQHGRSTP